MELKKALKTTRSWSYKQGFKKGIEIFANNHMQHGYFADEENEMTVRRFQHQINNGVDSQGNKLNFNQIEWRKGVIDAINYKSGSSRQRKQAPACFTLFSFVSFGACVSFLPLIALNSAITQPTVSIRYGSA